MKIWKSTRVFLVFVTCLLSSACLLDSAADLSQDTSQVTEEQAEITGDPVYDVSDTFIQKIVVEECTGTWCPWCVDGAVRMENLIVNYPGRIIGVAIHFDGLEIVNATPLTDYLGGVPFYPSGAVNRSCPSWVDEPQILVSRGYWSYIAEEIDTGSSAYGIRIDSVMVGTDLSVVVSFVQTTRPSDANRLTVYLTEDGVTGYPQANAYSGLAGYENHPYYTAPSTITDWIHDDVLRVVLSAPEGDPLPSVQRGVVVEKSYQYALPTGWDTSQMNVVAFIARHSDFPTGKAILNGQTARVGEVSGFSEY